MRPAPDCAAADSTVDTRGFTCALHAPSASHADAEAEASIGLSVRGVESMTKVRKEPPTWPSNT